MSSQAEFANCDVGSDGAANACIGAESKKGSESIAASSEAASCELRVSGSRPRWRRWQTPDVRRLWLGERERDFREDWFCFLFSGERLFLFFVPQTQSPAVLSPGGYEDDEDDDVACGLGERRLSPSAVRLACFRGFFFE